MVYIELYELTHQNYGIQAVALSIDQTNKPKKPSGPRTWRTRKDPFEAVEGRLKLLVELNPLTTAKSLR